MRIGTIPARRGSKRGMPRCRHCRRWTRGVSGAGRAAYRCVPLIHLRPCWRPVRPQWLSCGGNAPCLPDALPPLSSSPGTSLCSSLAACRTAAAGGMGKRRSDDRGKPAILTQMTAPYLWRRLHLREQVPLPEHGPDPNCSGRGKRGSKRNSWQRAHIFRR